MLILQKDIRITNSWTILLEWIGSKNAEYVGEVEIEGLLHETYPAYKAEGNPASPLVAYMN